MWLAALWMAGLALADVVNPPPEDCPSGAIGQSGHIGEWCAPHVCAERPCADDQTCETTGLCVVEEEVDCGGMTDPNNPCTFLKREAFGACEVDADCDQGTCITDDYCVDEGKVGGGDLCGCSSTGGASFVVLLALLPLGLRRRRASAPTS
jgi:MYXO-CTERM domain-containing protein